MTQALTVSARASAPEDHELVAAVRAGSDHAFALLHHRYRGEVESFLARRCGDHARAEDLAQEVFLAALRRLRSSEQPIALRPWLYEIARNASIDEFRRRQRVREIALEIDEDRPLPALTASPEAAFESKQALSDLRGALFGLSDSQHKLVVLRELEGRSYEEIAGQLGMSLSTVESSLFRARRRLSQEYDELASGRRCVRVQNAIDEGGARALSRLGVRERRQLSRHLAHCQPCRRHARAAGLDPQKLGAPSIREKVGALLPWPLPWLIGGRPRPALRLAPAAHRYMPFSGAAPDGGRAIAATAAALVAGLGGGTVLLPAAAPSPAAAKPVPPAAGPMFYPPRTLRRQVLVPAPSRVKAGAVSSANRADGHGAHAPAVPVQRGPGSAQPTSRHRPPPARQAAVSVRLVLSTPAPAAGAAAQPSSQSTPSATTMTAAGGQDAGPRAVNTIVSLPGLPVAGLGLTVSGGSPPTARTRQHTTVVVGVPGVVSITVPSTPVLAVLGRG